MPIRTPHLAVAAAALLLVLAGCAPSPDPGSGADPGTGPGSSGDLAGFSGDYTAEVTLGTPEYQGYESVTAERATIDGLPGVHVHGERGGIGNTDDTTVGTALEFSLNCDDEHCATGDGQAIEVDEAGELFWDAWRIRGGLDAHIAKSPFEHADDLGVVTDVERDADGDVTTFTFTTHLEEVNGERAWLVPLEFTATRVG